MTTIQIPCPKDCQHGTQEGWQALVLAASELAGGRELSYVGTYGPDKGDDPHPVHAWLVAPDWRETTPPPAPEQAVLVLPPAAYPPHKPGEYRPEVWTGDGRGAWDPSVLRRKPEVIEGEAQEYPAPLVSSRDGALPDVRPAAVKLMVSYLQERGWTVATLQYAEGHVPHATYGTPSATPRPSWGIRAERHGAAAVAVYMGQSKGYKWETLYVIAGRFLKYHTVAEFKEAVA